MQQASAYVETLPSAGKRKCETSPPQNQSMMLGSTRLHYLARPRRPLSLVLQRGHLFVIIARVADNYASKW